jgi:hypothetical protein
MSVHAGTIIHVAGNNVIDRLQSAGLGDVNVPIDTIREVGNYEVVDKVPQEPDFQFSLESWDVSTEMEAMLVGKVGSATPGASGAYPGAADPAGTEYKWSDCGMLNIISPWKDATTHASGIIGAGHIVPGYYPTRIAYNFGVTDNASQTVELSGGSFYYAKTAPVEEFATGDGSDKTFDTAEVPRQYRKGGSEGTEFLFVFGVIVDGVLQTEEVDYFVSDAGAGRKTITFVDAPANNALIRFAYFTETAKAYPQSVHASSITKPGAVRGRNIAIRFYLDAAASASVKVGGVQTVTLEATVDSTVEREFDNENIVGRTINGRDANGTLVVRSKDYKAFIRLMSQVTGVDEDEVFGWLNLHTVGLEIAIQNPKNTGEILKTLWVDDAQFQPPGTGARVNQPTDFTFRWASKSGDFSVFKGARPLP